MDLPGDIMRKLITYLKPYTLIIALALFMMAIELTVELAQPLLIARMIDEDRRWRT